MRWPVRMRGSLERRITDAMQAATAHGQWLPRLAKWLPMASLPHREAGDRLIVCDMLAMRAVAKVCDE